ncbi:Rieske 2Fe-2S domain-containing protein [bacterium]|nr:Rieske 2Fe-2S domain-containing protein [bacterium]
MAKHIVATVDEIPLGGRKIVEIAGRSIGVFHVDNGYYAIRNTCPHQGGPLCEGLLTGFLMADVPGEYTYTRRGEIVRCPWHGWEFDVKTGQSWWDPARTRVRSYEVAVGEVDPADVENGRIKGPYVAEHYAVSIEQPYVLVDVPGS